MLPLSEIDYAIVDSMNVSVDELECLSCDDLNTLRNAMLILNELEEGDYIA